MERSEFTALPVGVALGLLFDATPGLASVPAPELVRAPRYDRRVYRKGGFTWASEMLLADLHYWHKRKWESANGGGQYAEKDQKEALELGKFIAWREQSPNEPWSGTRGSDEVTAAPPSKFPKLNESTGRRNAPPPDEIPSDSSEVTDDGIPF